MAEIHSLKVHEHKYAPNEDIITVLRETLRDAKAGKIQAIGIACGVVDEEDEEGRASITYCKYTVGWVDALNSAVGSLFFRVFDRDRTTIKIPDLTEEDE